jgi:hypothetical protein
MRDPARVALAFAASLVFGGALAGAVPALAQPSLAAKSAEPGMAVDLSADGAAPDPILSADASDEDQFPPLPSADVMELSDWVLASGDNHGMPYLIVDKPDAAVFVYDKDGMQLGSAPALLGIAVGDDSAPGVGDLKLSNIPMDERTTPAGRFVAQLGPASDMKEVLWVDYDSSLSLHPVINWNPKERRLQRLRSPSPAERRISHGCINVPVRFYQDVVHPAFSDTKGVVYILPDTKSVDAVFPKLAAASGGDDDPALDLPASAEDTLGTEEAAAAPGALTR